MSIIRGVTKEIITIIYSSLSFLGRLRALLPSPINNKFLKLFFSLPLVFWFYKKFYFRKNNIDIKKRGINIFGYLLAESGLGESARSMVKIINKSGLLYNLISVDVFCRQRKKDKTVLIFSKLVEDNNYDINLLSINPNITETLIIEKGFNFINNKYNIGYWYWEFEKFPKHWIKNTQYYNEVWVASDFVKKALIKDVDLPVTKIPPIVEFLNINKGLRRRNFNIPDDSFVFLFVFDSMSYFQRKNPAGLVRAFKKAFGEHNQKVTLVIKCSGANNSNPYLQELFRLSENYPVIFINKYLEKKDLNSLMFLADCYVSLHRSEGFGLTMAEAMLLGKPTIATNYSGNLDFMNDKNSYLVDYDLVKVGLGDYPYAYGNYWAEPKVEHAAELMYYVYKNREKAEEKGRLGQSDMQDNYNINKVTKLIKNRIDYIIEKHGRN